MSGSIRSCSLNTAHLSGPSFYTWIFLKGTQSFFKKIIKQDGYAIEEDAQEQETSRMFRVCCCGSGPAPSNPPPSMDSLSTDGWVFRAHQARSRRNPEPANGVGVGRRCISISDSFLMPGFTLQPPEKLLKNTHARLPLAREAGFLGV